MSAEQQWAVYVLMLGLFIGVISFVALLTLQQSRRHAGKDPVKSRLPLAASAAMAYGFYLGAALLAGAKMPEFLRNHLFDGLAPAATVGFLINLFPFDNAAEAFKWIRLPAFICFWLYVGGAVLFGSIGAAAVFSSGSSDFFEPVTVSAVTGGSTFLAFYIVTVTDDLQRRHETGTAAAAKWLFTRREKPTRSSASVSS
jgi:hypothetical protein